MKTNYIKIEDLQVGDRIIYNESVTQITSHRVDFDRDIGYIEMDNGEYLFCPINTLFERAEPIIIIHNP